MIKQTSSARQSRQNSVTRIHTNNNNTGTPVIAPVNQSQQLISTNISQQLATVSEYGAGGITQTPNPISKDSRFHLRDKIIKNAAKAAVNQNNDIFQNRRKSVENSSSTSVNTSNNAAPSTTSTQFLRRNIISRLADQNNKSAVASQVLFQQLLSKMRPHLTASQLEKFQGYILSPSFSSLLTNKSKDARQLAQMIFEVLSIPTAASQDQLQALQSYIQQTINATEQHKLSQAADHYTNTNISPVKTLNNNEQNNQRNVMSVGKLHEGKYRAQYLTSNSLSELPYIHKVGSNTKPNKNKDNQYKDRCTSPTVITSSTVNSRITDVTRSTAFSRPFTSLSYVSSTTIGTSLTSKIEKLNKVTIKSFARQFIQCQHQIQSVLNKNKLEMKSMLTISEIMWYIMQGDTDLNLTLDQLNNVVLAVMLIQPRNDILISLSSLLKACQLYVNQTDIEQRDFFNKSRMDKMLDAVRDHLYSSVAQGNSTQNQLRSLFIKFSEADSENYDKIVMTLDQFGKFMRNTIGDKYSMREFEQVYRNIVSKKPLTFSRFVKVFSPAISEINDQWFATAIKQLRDYIIKKKMTSQQAFEKFLMISGSAVISQDCTYLSTSNQKSNGKISKVQFRDILKREGLPFTLPQIDHLFTKFDTKNDSFIDFDEWKALIQDDFLNPLQMIREVVQEYELTQADLLHKMRRRIRDSPMDFSLFKENMAAINTELSQLQLKSLFDTLKNQDGKVEYTTLMANLTGDKAETLDFKKQTEKSISQYIVQNDLVKEFRAKFESIDTANEGRISNQQLLLVFKQLKVPIAQVDLERYIKMIEKDNKNNKGVLPGGVTSSNRFNYIDLVHKIEDTKQNIPLKSIGMRLAVFLKQNGLTAKKLLEKLIQTKNSSDDNKKRQKMGTTISNNFFAKFIKAKVDKKRSVQEIKQLVADIDLDRDGIISSCDLEAFLGRINFQNFFEAQTNNDISYVSHGPSAPVRKGLNKSNSNTHSTGQLITQKALYPTVKLTGEKLAELIRALKQGIHNKNMSVTEAFRRLDSEQAGLISFSIFQANIDQIINISQILKEKLFAKMDNLNIGLISYQQFKQVVNQSPNSEIEGIKKENNEQVRDSFDWEQSIIKKISDWIKSQNLSLVEAFKIIDQDFDGIISIRDIKDFLQGVLNVPEQELLNTKIERLYKILDVSKTGKIYQQDFMTLFQVSHNQYINETLNQNQQSSGWSRSNNNKFSKSQERQGLIKTNTNGLLMPSYKESQYDWKKSAIQQAGIYFSKNYDTVDLSFKAIAIDRPNEQSIIKLADFQQFINQNQVLKGFNLTQQLIQELFASMDPHKKGYLVLTDWQKNFREYFSKNVGVNLSDIQSTIANSFATLDEAFSFFSLLSNGSANKVNPSVLDSSVKIVTFGGFCSVFEQLLPDRYSKQQLLQIWTSLLKNCGIITQGDSAQDQSINSIQEFKKIFQGISFKGQLSQQDRLTKQIIKVNANRSSSVMSPLRIESNYSNLDSLLSPQNQQNINTSAANILESQNQVNLTRANLNIDPVSASIVKSNLVLAKLSRNLKSHNMSILDLFQNNDQNIHQNYLINAVELKNGLQKIFISGKEVEQLLDLGITAKSENNATSVGLIDLQLLASKLQKIDNEDGLIGKRNQVRIDQIKRMMFDYMGSPEESFKYFDIENKGKLTYMDFSKLVTELYTMAAKESVPNYPIVKDMFDQIDIRKDNIIDYNEWSKTFEIPKRLNTSSQKTRMRSKSRTANTTINN